MSLTLRSISDIAWLSLPRSVWVWPLKCGAGDTQHTKELMRSCFPPLRLASDVNQLILKGRMYVAVRCKECFADEEFLYLFFSPFPSLRCGSPPVLLCQCRCCGLK